MAGTSRGKASMKELKPKNEPKKKNYLYKKSEPFEKGIILKDTQKNEWRIVELIGQGGFGDIYSAEKVGGTSSSKSKSMASYAVKIEPHDNGPLFTEMHIFIKILRTDKISQWKKAHKLTFLGIPEYFGSSSYIHKGMNHRFLVMNRFGDSINAKLFGKDTKLSLPHLKLFSSQIIDALHYIHDSNYFHGDIKADNLLLKYNSDADEIFLVDYGLAHTCYTEQELKPDKKKQHNGTLLFCSCDSHLGIGTKRGDLEMLGYNLLSWCGYEFPWKNDTNPNLVHQKKNDLMASLDTLLENTSIPSELKEYMTYVKSLHHLDIPDYDYIKRLLNSIGSKVPSSSKQELTSSRKRKATVNIENLKDKSGQSVSNEKTAVTSARVKRTTKQTVPEDLLESDNEPLPVTKTKTERTVPEDSSESENETSPVSSENIFDQNNSSSKNDNKISNSAEMSKVRSVVNKRGSSKDERVSKIKKTT